MGYEYYVVCHDCKKSLELEKLRLWPDPSTPQVQAWVKADEVRKNALEIAENSDTAMFRLVLLYLAVMAHPGHRIEAMGEDKFQEKNYDREYGRGMLGSVWGHKY